MSRDVKFLATWAAEKETYLALGKYLSHKVREQLAELIDPIEVDYFLKTPPNPRVKADNSLLQKAFYRGKEYADPYGDITDKVGLRFVVLLGRDIRLAEEALRSIKLSEFSKDKDYEEEQKANPIAFDYAAVHFVVRLTEDVSWGGVTLPAGWPCEVQIKTLLQHAYSELTHDTIYKPQIQATHDMQRRVAKAMALLEATNDYFEQVDDSVSKMIEDLSEVTGTMSKLYKQHVNFDAAPSVLEGLILEGFGQLAEGDYASQVEELLSEKPYIPDRIRRQIEMGNPIYQQPSVFLVYLDIARNGSRAIERWHLTASELEPLLNDLGEGST